MKRNSINLVLSFLLIILLINNSTFFLSPIRAQNIDYEDNYNISYDLSGDISIVGTGRYIASGIVKISAKHDSSINITEYSIQYSASIPTTNLEGETRIKENLTNKKLIYNIVEQGIIGIIWNSYSNNSQNELYSVFHMTRNEIDNNSFRFLNFTSNNVNDFNLFSPGLGKSVKTYRSSFRPASDQDINLFFDVTYLRLVGIHSKIVLQLDGGIYLINTAVVVSDASFPLLKANLDPIFIILNSLIAGFIVILLILLIRYEINKRGDVYLKGGLSE